MSPQDRLVLIDALLDGSISDADRLRIEAELSVDAAVRKEYYDRLQLDLLLEREVRESGFTIPSSASSAAADRHWRKWIAAASMVIAASFLLVIFWHVRSKQWAEPTGSASTIAVRSEPSASGFAVLGGQADAVWHGAALAEGDLLPSGDLHLETGRVQIELFSGVQVVLEGDSLFSVDSSMQMTVRRGRLRARVPEPAQGFRIKTDSGDVVDLGTEFSLDVGDEGAEVHVVDGEIELHPTNSDSLRVDAGKAVRLAGSGNVTGEVIANDGLMGPDEFQNLLSTQQESRMLQWQQASERMHSDPRALAYYRFDRESIGSRRVRNLVVNQAERASDGTLVAATLATDRWGRSDSALDFSRVGSRVRVNVPGEHRGLTLMTWVKINSLDRWYNSLFLTDGHEDREPHWQIMQDGRVFFSVKLPTDAPDRGNNKKQHVYYSPKIWDASLIGRWVMLAVTYDVDRARVTHYFNGQPISSERIPAYALIESVRIGPASICNWSEPMYRTDPEFVLRNLNGSMDEFALYAGPLTAEEISQLYRVGNPNEF